MRQWDAFSYFIPASFLPSLLLSPPHLSGEWILCSVPSCSLSGAPFPFLGPDCFGTVNLRGLWGSWGFRTFHAMDSHRVRLFGLLGFKISFIYMLVVSCGSWDLPSQTRDWTGTLGKWTCRVLTSGIPGKSHVESFFLAPQLWGDIPRRLSSKESACQIRRR